MKITIVGGCFTVQHNIPHQNLYHQSILRKLVDDGIKADLDIIRYERVKGTLEKICRSHKEKPVSILFFHLRTEPFIRLGKLYYKYLDTDDKLRHSLNLPSFGIINPEKYDLAVGRRIVSETSKRKSEGWIHKSFRQANNWLGYLIGNQAYALKFYADFITKLDLFCRKEKIRLILLGPVSLRTSDFEEHLSGRIDIYFKKYSLEKDMEYIRLLGHYTGNGSAMHFSNRLHVSQAGHDHIAGLMYESIRSRIPADSTL